MKNINQTSPEATAANANRTYSKGARIAIIAVSAFLAAVLIFGLVLGGIITARNESYVMVCDGYGIDTGVASYLASYFKARYITYMKQSGINVEDTIAFWTTEVGIGTNTYADYLIYETDEYVKKIVAAVALFDQHAELTDSEIASIKVATDEILEFRHGGSVSEFNRATAELGFDYDDFCRATEMIYKAWAVSTKIFGSKGENIISYPEYYNNFLYNYSRVKILVIRTESKFVTDEAGNRLKGDDGNDLTVTLTAEEKAVREARIEELRTVMAGINEGSIAPERFDELLAGEYNEGDKTANARNGYYFLDGTEYTESFREGLPKVVETAVEMDIGTVSEVKCDFGVCFIMREQVVKGANENTDETWCFSDYNASASVMLYEEMLTEMAKTVEVRDKWYEIDPVLIPYTSDYVARL